jgi:hypothetical protein
MRYSFRLNFPEDEMSIYMPKQSGRFRVEVRRNGHRSVRYADTKKQALEIEYALKTGAAARSEDGEAALSKDDFDRASCLCGRVEEALIRAESLVARLEGAVSRLEGKTDSMGLPPPYPPAQMAPVERLEHKPGALLVDAKAWNPVRISSRGVQMHGLADEDRNALRKLKSLSGKFSTDCRAFGA